MLPDIKGEHYRFSQDQWDAVCAKFNIRGIPAYVLADKTGKATLRNDFPDVDLMKKCHWKNVKNKKHFYAHNFIYLYFPVSASFIEAGTGIY